MIEQNAGKVVIIGAGLVGSTYAYSLMINGVVSEIALIDTNRDRLEGEIMDLNHGISFVRPVAVYAGTYQDCHDASVIVLCAGSNQKPGETRIDLLTRNAAIFRAIIEQINRVGTEALLLIAANPVDIMTYITCKLSGFPSNRVIGSGTVLDSARFRYLLSKHCHIDPTNVHAYVIGEHGDTEVPVWSLANVAGLRFSDYCPVCTHPCEGLPKEQIFTEVKNAAYKIIKGKGATYYAIGLALVEITESILRNEFSVLTVSTLLQGEYGINDVCLSVPTVVSRSGVERRILLSLTPEEAAGLKHSAEVLQSILQEIHL